MDKSDPARADVMLLLREIKRLRAERLRDFQLRDRLLGGGSTFGEIQKQHLAALLVEPCVNEQEVWMGLESWETRKAEELRRIGFELDDHGAPVRIQRG